MNSMVMHDNTHLFNAHLLFLWQEFLKGSLHPCWLLINIDPYDIHNFALNVLARNDQNPESFPIDFVKRQVDCGSYPNKFVLKCEEDSSEISIEQVRNLHHFLSHHPAIPGWRVVVIDCVDHLNRFSSNALLKITEEPPSKTLILGVCCKLGKVLPTLRSRFQKVARPAEEFIDSQVLERVRNFMIQAYKGNFHEITAWSKTVQKKTEPMIFKAILENLYLACLKRPNDEKLLNCYAHVEKWISSIDNMSLDLSYAILSCFVKVYEGVK